MDLIITLILFLNFENKIDKNKTEGTEIATTFQKKKTRVCTVKSVNKASPPLTKKKKRVKSHGLYLFGEGNYFLSQLPLTEREPAFSNAWSHGLYLCFILPLWSWTHSHRVLHKEVNCSRKIVLIWKLVRWVQMKLEEHICNKKKSLYHQALSHKFP